MYSRNAPTLVSDGKEIKEALAEAIKHLPHRILNCWTVRCKPM
jgi:hypothetical protein